MPREIKNSRKFAWPCVKNGAGSIRFFTLILTGVFFNIIFCHIAASQPPIPENRDTLNFEEAPVENIRTQKFRSPGRAAMLSAALPGLGQAYNGVFWKIPIIYAGFGGIVYAVNFNNNGYQTWRKAYIAKVDDNPNTPDNFINYSDASLKRAMDFYRRNLELTYILGVALYLLNVLDANVQAHLMDFDVGPDLGMKIQPSFEPLPAFAGPVGHSAGLKLSFRF